MKQRLQEDLKAAMKSGDKLRMMAIRGLLSEITRVEKDVRRDATEAEIVQLVKRERARRAEALEFAKKANRADLIEQNETEAKILAGYLPPELSLEEVSAAVNEIIAGGATQMGAVMKALRERFGAQLDGKVASDRVKQALAPK
ncbi:MAG TPA: GatB/YqeY domain-containing protein [Candidatus Binataceae bacterium]|nr:GatB/YqeY domain-containing protein [Candidatus Binataceae bacterium]